MASRQPPMLRTAQKGRIQLQQVRGPGVAVDMVAARRRRAPPARLGGGGDVDGLAVAERAGAPRERVIGLAAWRES